jgi:hypothetical protein
MLRSAPPRMRNGAQDERRPFLAPDPVRVHGHLRLPDVGVIAERAPRHTGPRDGVARFADVAIAIHTDNLEWFTLKPRDELALMRDQPVHRPVKRLGDHTDVCGLQLLGKLAEFSEPLNPSIFPELDRISRGCLHASIDHVDSCVVDLHRLTCRRTGKLWKIRSTRNYWPRTPERTYRGDSTKRLAEDEDCSG